jgi:anti-sigma B factor antagonist
MPENDGQDGLTVTIERRTAATTIVLVGELDLASSGTLDGAVQSLLPVANPMVVDVAGVTFIDSTGLRSLLWLHEQAVAASGVGIRLANVNAAVHRLLELTGLVGTFEVDGATSPAEG